MEFKVSGKNIEVFDTRSESEDFVVFGVRACDVKSFDILDRVFLTEPVDSFYGSRRQHGIIISLACTRPSETCFCKTFGIDPSEPAGDISAWKTESEIFFLANTEKGEELLNKLSALTEECDDSAYRENSQSVKTCGVAVNLQHVLSENTVGIGYIGIYISNVTVCIAYVGIVGAYTYQHKYRLDQQYQGRRYCDARQHLSKRA
jgi:hypothetical protein